MLLPSVLGFALCFVCLAATTWAWFMVSVTSYSNTIQTASFEVNVAVTDGTNTVNAETDGSYNLPVGTYTVTWTKTGSAKNVYFLIKNGAAEPYRMYLDSGDVTNPFTIEVADDTTATITLKWGKLPDNPPIDTGSATALLNEDPADEIQQEEEKENQQEEETPSDEQNPADDTNTSGEEKKDPDTSTDTPAEGEGGQPSTPTEGENGQQGGEQPDVSGETTGGDIGDDTTTGGETPTDTTTPTGGDVPTEPVVTTDPAAQSEGGAPTDPVATE